MITINNGTTHIICDSCKKEIIRKSTMMDVLNRILLPEGWGGYHVFSSGMEFCSDKKCQNILKQL
jgi:hypothetical protein